MMDWLPIRGESRNIPSHLMLLNLDSSQSGIGNIQDILDFMFATLSLSDLDVKSDLETFKGHNLCFISRCFFGSKLYMYIYTGKQCFSND